jgi:8-oxo-dGTP pyrophosphatase MutT (NUDIX family)
MKEEVCLVHLQKYMNYFICGGNMKNVVFARIRHGGKTLLGKVREDHSNNPNLWNFFGGNVEKGEDNLTALFRELSEEIGSIPYDFNCKFSGIFVMNNKVVFFYEIAVVKKFTPKLSIEHQKAAWCKEKNKNLHPIAKGFLKHFTTGD